MKKSKIYLFIVKIGIKYALFLEIISKFKGKIKKIKHKVYNNTK